VAQWHTRGGGGARPDQEIPGSPNRDPDSRFPAEREAACFPIPDSRFPTPGHSGIGKSPPKPGKRGIRFPILECPGSYFSTAFFSTAFSQCRIFGRCVDREVQVRLLYVTPARGPHPPCRRCWPGKALPRPEIWRRRRPPGAVGQCPPQVPRSTQRARLLAARGRSPVRVPFMLLIPPKPTTPTSFPAKPGSCQDLTDGVSRCQQLPR
jgi:hypothetical protein